MVRVYAAFERLPVKDGAARVRYLRILCNISYELQELDKAIEYAFELSIHAVDATDRAFAYNSLGLAYDSKGDQYKAIEYYVKTLAIQLKALGPEHPHVARTYHNIGATYAEKDDKEKAMAYLLKAKAIRMKRLGPEHPDTKATQHLIDLLIISDTPPGPPRDPDASAFRTFRQAH